MIGSTVKLGFDGESVKHGMAGIGKLFGNLGKQIAIGGARQIGSQMTDLFGKALSYLPDLFKQTTEWAGSINDLANATGMAKSEVIQLMEAFRLTGIDADPGKAILTMRENIFKATRDFKGGEAQALFDIGIDPQTIANLKPMEQFMKIMEALAKKGPQWQELASASSAIFGGKIGKKGLQLANDWSGTMKQVESNVGDFARRVESIIGPLDEMGDAMGRLDLLQKAWMVSGLKGFFGAQGIEGGRDAINAMFDKLLDYSAKFEEFGASIRTMFTDLAKSFEGKSIAQGLGDAFRQMGKWLGEGFKEGLGGIGGILTGTTAGNPAQEPGGRPSWLGAGIAASSLGLFAPAAAGTAIGLGLSNLLGATNEQTNILEKIYRDGGGATFQ